MRIEQPYALCFTSHTVQSLDTMFTCKQTVKLKRAQNNILLNPYIKYVIRKFFRSPFLRNPKRPAPHATPALEQAALLFICALYNYCISRTIWLCFRLLRQMLL